MRRQSIPYSVLIGALAISWFSFGNGNSIPIQLKLTEKTQTTEPLRIYENETGMITRMEQANWAKWTSQSMTKKRTEIRIKRCME